MCLPSGYSLDGLAEQGRKRLLAILGENPLSGSPLGGALPPWLDKPHRLISLGEIVDRLNAAVFLDLLKELDALAEQLSGAGTLGAVSTEQLESTRKICLLLTEGLLAMAFDASMATVSRMLRSLDGGRVTMRELQAFYEEVQGRVRDELGGVYLLHLDMKEAEFYENPRRGWELTEKRFPKATRDIEEASKCLALNRGTAAVFHLMCVMENGLKAIAKIIDIPYAPSWESYLKQMQRQLDLSWDKKSAKQKKNDQYVREAHGFLSAVKVAWRNPTVHVRRDYTPEEAEEVYGAVKSLMRHLSSLPIRKRV